MADVRLIDANELIDWLTKPTDFRGNCEDCTEIDCIDCIIENAIKYAPTVNAAPVVHGRWCFMGLWEECSVCKHPISVDGERTNFCPNCGAKMDLEVTNNG